VKECSLVEPLRQSQRTLCTCSLDTAAGVDIQCLEDVTNNENDDITAAVAAAENDNNKKDAYGD